MAVLAEARAVFDGASVAANQAQEQLATATEELERVEAEILRLTARRDELVAVVAAAEAEIEPLELRRSVTGAAYRGGVCVLCFTRLFLLLLMVLGWKSPRSVVWHV